jgi:hypothetical protein
MSNVKIMPNKAGAMYTAYDSNPEYGYIRLSESTRSIANGFVSVKEKSCLIRGKVADLQMLIKDAKYGTLPGRITVQEYLESEVPEHIVNVIHNDAKMTWEEAIKSYVKRAGNDGMELTYGGERIIRYSFYDESGSSTDIKVQNDNTAEVREFLAQRKAATLPA